MTRDQMGAVADVVCEVIEERKRQHAKWGEQDFANGTGPDFRASARVRRENCEYAHRHGGLTYLHILDEEVYEAFAESDPVKLRAELIQVAAVAVQWVEKLDREARR
jgi:hypothetical protein